MLHQFAYISNEKQYFTDEDLRVLMMRAREKNKRMELTGLLLYDNGAFLQVLEGPQDSIEIMKQELLNDSRHENMDVIYSSDKLFEREFANWRMGFQILGSHKNKDYLSLDDRVKELLKKAKPNGAEAHDLIAQYTQLKNSSINLNLIGTNINVK